MSLCLCLTGDISTVVGAKVHGFEKKELSSASHLGKVIEETTKVSYS